MDSKKENYHLDILTFHVKHLFLVQASLITSQCSGQTEQVSSSCSGMLARPKVAIVEKITCGDQANPVKRFLCAQK